MYEWSLEFTNQDKIKEYPTWTNGYRIRKYLFEDLYEVDEGKAGRVEVRLMIIYVYDRNVRGLRSWAHY